MSAAGPPQGARAPSGGSAAAPAASVGASTFGKVAVLMGGHSAEREVSLMSGSGVLKALQSKGVNAHAFDPAERDLCELKRKGFKRCFIALHGRFGEDGTVQGALELLGIPYTGSGVMASSISIDKVTTKRVWMAEGLATPKYVLLRRGACTREQVLAVYRAVKPLFEPLGLTVDHLGLTARGSWELELDTGAVIELGSGSPDDVTARTQRFVQTLTQVASRYGRRPEALVSADLRHTNGYAVHLRGVGTTGADAANKK